MKVAYVLGTSVGGTRRHVRMLADGLARRGVTVNVYAPAGTGPQPDPAVPASAPGAVSALGTPPGVSAETRGPAGGSGGSPPRAGTAAETRGPVGGSPRFAAVEIADRPRPVRDLAAVRRLRALFAGSRPDVVHAHGLRAGALAALAVGRRVPRPLLIVTVHNAAPDAGPARAVYRLLERLVARRADAVLCVSSDLEARMRQLGARHVARAVVPTPPLGVSAETRKSAGGSGGSPPRASTAAETVTALRAELGVGRSPVVLAVARLAPQKGLHTLVDAGARWGDREPRPLLVIAGTGPLRDSLARRAEAAGVPVRFLGQRDDVPALLAAADVVVLPSRWEGQPLIVQETLRAGRPLVASRAGGIPDLTGEDAALLVLPGDATALSAAVLSVLDGPDLAARLSQAALSRWNSLPGEEDALDAALAAYHEPDRG